MNGYLLRLPEREATLRFPNAGDAYRWLDANARIGEPYKLGCVNGHPSRLQVIDASTYRRPDADPAA